MGLESAEAKEVKKGALASLLRGEAQDPLDPLEIQG